MSWSSVGEWLKGNAGSGVALVGSLMTGNLPGAIAAGISMVSSATGTNDAAEALLALRTDPASIVRLKELAYANEASIREHIRMMAQQELDDRQKEHAETQATIRSGDNADDVVVRRTRPLQSWLSLVGALVYVATKDSPSAEILMLLLALPWTYAGLRQIGKGIDSFTSSRKP